MAETAPINSKSQIEEGNVITSKMSHIENTLNEDRGTKAEDSAAPRCSQRERDDPLKSLNIPS